MNMNTRLFTLGVIATIIIGACGGYLLYRSVSATTHDGNHSACSGTHKDYQIVIKDEKATPSHIDARLCDTIKFSNEGNDGVLIAFGEHENHVAYDGVTEHMLGKSESFTIVANQAGKVEFHDHIRDIVAGDFTVTP